MKTAIKSAMGYLMGLSADTNPIPYNKFHACIDNQVKWAKERNSTIDPERLADVLTRYLAEKKVFIESEDMYKSAVTEEIPHHIEFTMPRNDPHGAARLSKWISDVLNTAELQLPDSISFTFTANFKKGDSVF